MSNGSNTWRVSFSRISFMERVLRSHSNVVNVERTNDIVFHVQRKSGDASRILCLDEYVVGISAVQRAIAEFGEIDVIVTATNWNRYTREAKQYCLERRIGLYNVGEINGALWREDFWAFRKTDQDGNPEYPYGST